ncbi:MAG: von Willebrand factor type A domain-containing protein [Chloroflexota bacterium]|nr:von Willebrand factor type A domain-containing protein [Chloroflexota bacterium]
MKEKIRNLSVIGLALAIGLAVVACGSSAAPAPAAPLPPVAPQPPQAAVPAAAAPASMPTVAAAMAAPAAPAPPPAATTAPAPAMMEAEETGEVQKPISRSAAAPAPAAPQSSGGQTAQSQLPPDRKGGQPGATTFADYERTPFVYASDDSVSTFSLDTDRTSYHLALNWAREGYDVEPDSVRAEEWINAFNYGYAQPSQDDSFAVHTDVIPHPLDNRMALARIAFQAPELRDDGRPLNVTLVLDASGSMADGDRVDIAREAAESIRNSLRRDDRIAVVHFTDEVIDKLTVEHSKPDSRDVRRSIDRLDPGGSTNVQAGLDLGVQLAHEARWERPNSHNYVILMSDGVANVDATNPFAILESAGDYDNSNPLRLITIGVGIQNYNDYLLEQLAQHGNGWYRYLDDTGQARATFSRENWLALSIPFADQTRAQVTWNPEVVQSWRIVGYENRVTADENFAQARKEFAEIPSGAATTVFYELELVEYARRGDVLNMGDVEVRWVTPVSNESNRQHAQVLAKYDDAPNDRDGALLELGALVALASDRYSSLPYPDAPYDVHEDLAVLKSDLRDLDRHVGELAAYRDFSFLIEHIARDIPKQASGYSR